MSASTNYTIVEYLAENEGYSCGYCKSSTSNYSHGMWAHKMTVQDYQNLIDRGWRRSGQYCYKPTMNLTCCPQYTIRCDALQIKLSKSQKTVLKKMNRYLTTDWFKEENISTVPADGNDDHAGNETDDNVQLRAKLAEKKLSLHNLPQSMNTEIENEQILTESGAESTTESATELITGSVTESVTELVTGSVTGSVTESATDLVTGSVTESIAESITESTTYEKIDQMTFEESKSIKVGLGPDPNKPPSKKAKLLRKERRQQKAAKNSTQMPVDKPQKRNVTKQLEDFLSEPQLENIRHKLEIRLVRSKPKSSEFNRTLEQSHRVFSKYQQAIHNDPPDKCTMSHFTRFLVKSPLEIKLVRSHPASDEFNKTRDASFLLYQKYQMTIHEEEQAECDEECFLSFLVQSPLKPLYIPNGPSSGFGSFHQQYWLDDKLIAVGVIDIMPKCVSSVYFYYDPDYRFLTLGTYASLREIAFTRELQKQYPPLQFYYMGFYIHSCTKMRYKGRYHPSFLLCPEVYTWHKIEDCLPKLDQSKYSRLEEDPHKCDTNECDVKSVSVLYKHITMSYGEYLRRTNSDIESEVVQYNQLVGGICAINILLFRS